MTISGYSPVIVASASCLIHGPIFGANSISTNKNGHTDIEYRNHIMSPRTLSTLVTTIIGVDSLHDIAS